MINIRFFISFFAFVFLFCSISAFAQSPKDQDLAESFLALDQAVLNFQEDQNFEGLITSEVRKSGQLFGRSLNGYFSEALETKKFEREELEQIIQVYVNKATALPIKYQQEILRAIQQELLTEQLPDLGVRSLESEAEMIHRFYISALYRITSGAVVAGVALWPTGNLSEVTVMEGAVFGLTVFLPEVARSMAFLFQKATGDIRLNSTEEEKREIATAQLVKDRFLNSKYLSTCSKFLVIDSGSDEMGPIQY